VSFREIDTVTASRTLLKRISESVPWFVNASSDLSKIQWIKSTQNILSYFEVCENIINIVQVKNHNTKIINKHYENVRKFSNIRERYDQIKIACAKT